MTSMFTLAAIISTPLLTKLAIFGAVACGAWLLLDLLSKGKPRAEARLDDFRDPSRRRGEGAAARAASPSAPTA